MRALERRCGPGLGSEEVPPEGQHPLLICTPPHPPGALARRSLTLCPYPQLFKGKFYHCLGVDTRNITNRSDCVAANYRWVHHKYNFDNLGQVSPSHTRPDPPPGGGVTALGANSSGIRLVAGAAAFQALTSFSAKGAGAELTS